MIRYELHVDDGLDDCDMRESADGDYVLFTDHQAENARLKAALEKLANEKNLQWTGTIVQEFARAALGKEST
jgi:hypothetical protein